MWIAALVPQHRLKSYVRGDRFDRLPQIARVQTQVCPLVQGIEKVARLDSSQRVVMPHSSAQRSMYCSSSGSLFFRISSTSARSRCR
jgi:hypothetical protein